MQQPAVGLQQRRALAEVRGGQRGVAQQRAALKLAIDMAASLVSEMKPLISFMKTGLSPRSSDTAATTAVTSAGIAATSENSATTLM